MKSTSRMFKALLGGFLVFALTGQALAQGGTWETKAPMPTARYGSAAGVIGGKLYVATGCCVFDAFPHPRFTDLEVYDPDTDTWTTKAPIPTAIYGAAVGVIDDKLYVAGGSASQIEGNNIATLQVYDPATDTWSTKAPMPFAGALMAAGVIDGKLYAAGGMNPSNTDVVNTLRVYDAATDTWVIKASMPTARASAGGGVVNGILYAVGGYTGSFFATVEAYDPAMDTWTTKASMPTARYLHAVGVVNGILYAVGGYTGSLVATVEAYDPAMDTWTTKASMPTARILPAVGVVNGILYAAGGTTDGINHLNVLEAFRAVPTSFQVCPLYDQTKAVRSGATVPIKLALCAADGSNQSSSSIVVTAASFTQVSTSAPGAVTDAGNANPDNNFRFDSALAVGGGYIFNLKTTGLGIGTYNLNFFATGDAVMHAVQFQVK